ncbi:MAG TPA: hypothetical protein PKD64_05635 [Pirellulaceae bacterium]|nr:hypothetical protein [Pirellulaceae bacterium]HMO91660.1 hypothetical protein [Pirellulaceae bacterium]HMP68357.1 hypothetical protein [Pirellulaceae bacterium]
MSHAVQVKYRSSQGNCPCWLIEVYFGMLRLFRYCICSGLLVVLPISQMVGQEADLTEQQKANFERFERLLSNVKLVGSFTELSQSPTDLKEEEYVIQQVTKSDEGDKWIFRAEIKYGNNRFVVPLELDVIWAGDTPVITLTDLTIPTLGTFSARVLFHEGKYSGTWSHGDKGGHLFGRIVSQSEDQESAAGADKQEPNDGSSPKTQGDK